METERNTPMNKTAIKNFAVWARTTLLTAVKQKAFEYEITEDGEMDVHLTAIEGRLLTEEEKKQRRELIDKIKEDGYEQVMEQTAYIWFNRFIALRFMEVNGYLPSRVRVFTDDSGEFRPAILKEAMNLELDGLDREKVYGYLEEQNNEELYKYLLLTQCNALNKCLPYMFEKIDNYTELLFPSGLLKADSVIGRMISEIPEEDWTDQVQIIGWLYQYYNSELKDDTFARLKKNTKISKDRIPAATQLFTPDWIVRYMVENSLGRLWLEGHPNDSLKAEWKYYLEEAEQEPEVEAQLLEIRREYQNIKPEEIKVIDPCMGSGHILVAAFDVLMKIYTSCGWSERDAAKSIVENNLYGLDIDDRAGQLAYFSVMMEARKYNRRILHDKISFNIMSISEPGADNHMFLDYLKEIDEKLYSCIEMIKTLFLDGKEFGSLIRVPEMDFDLMAEKLYKIGAELPNDLFSITFTEYIQKSLLPLIKQGKLLALKFDIVLTNPPYMGRKSLNNHLGEYLEQNYEIGKSELYSAFIVRCLEMTKNSGFASMVTMHTWMFISSFKKLRENILNSFTINSMVHSGAATFDGVSAFNVLATTFCIQNSAVKKFKGKYVKLNEFYNTSTKLMEYHNKSNIKTFKQEDFEMIPGAPLVYWISNNAIDNFKNSKSLRDFFEPKQGLATGNNNCFVRLWHEVKRKDIYLGARNTQEFHLSEKKYAPYNKGGNYRKWYGENTDVIKFDKFNYNILLETGNHLPSRMYYFREGITWSLFGFENFGVRYKSKGFVFDVSGASVFPETEQVEYVIAFLSSKVAFLYLSMLAPTVNFQVGNIGDLPLIFNQEFEYQVKDVSNKNITMSMKDWDSYETSWDFKKHPLI